jgi:hypothetical protein
MTTLITKLLTNPRAQSRPAADAGDQSPASGRSTTHADCRWHRRSQGFESPKLHSLSLLVRLHRIGVISALCLVLTGRGGRSWGSLAARWAVRAPGGCLWRQLRLVGTYLRPARDEEVADPALGSARAIRSTLEAAGPMAGSLPVPLSVGTPTSTRNAVRSSVRRPPPPEEQ